MFFGQCIDFQMDLLLERSRWSSYIQRTDDSVAVMPLSQKTVLRQVFSSCCCFSYFMVNAVSNSRFSCIEGEGCTFACKGWILPNVLMLNLR
ncbi:hypothetical protein D1609_17720 [Leptospira borgpetersenii serovar Hardjo-bovis]|nr:hypothetical protein D1609_17720 [Leptospira borgpetersenii serovar Hardjo-bovis]TQE52735.1 hypothetical protein FFZ95_09660 [Leptospira borgpetersenii]TQE56616.1 hypothetical protein FFZ96_09230 [Leptospira borgpetersenii]